MMRANHRLGLLVVAVVLGGCSNFAVPTRLDGDFPRKGALIPATNLKLTPSISIALEKVINWGIYAGVAYLVLDPMAPNWHIEEAPLGDQHIHFSMKMKRFYIGGAGEARAVFNRRAKELMQLNGFDAYEVVEYSEGLESSVLGSQRTAEGVIKLTKKAVG